MTRDLRMLPRSVPSQGKPVNVVSATKPIQIGV